MRANTAVAVDALRAMTTPSRIEEFLDYLSPDATWAIPGDWPRISGVQQRPQLDGFARIAMPAGFPTGCDLDVLTVGEAGTTVYVEVVVTARTAKGRDYKNAYCFALDFENGKISAIREYMDTLYADRVLHR